MLAKAETVPEAVVVGQAPEAVVVVTRTVVAQEIIQLTAQA